MVLQSQEPHMISYMSLKTILNDFNILLYYDFVIDFRMSKE